MKLKRQSQVSFYDDENQNLEVSPENKDTMQLDKPLPVYDTLESSSDDRNLNRKIPRFVGLCKIFPENYWSFEKMRVIDPESDIFSKWNRVFLCTCILALFVDPMFFYLPLELNIGSSSSCLGTDRRLKMVVTCFRSLADVFYLLNVIIKFRTAYVNPSSRVFGKGELVMDPKMIAHRYFKSGFFLDLITSLPLPQIMIWFIIPANKISSPDHASALIALVLVLQYVPRLYLIFPLSSQIIKAAGVVTLTGWSGAAYNLLLYLVASHVAGASWYLFSIERRATCLTSECSNESSPVQCFLPYLDCDNMNDNNRLIWVNNTQVFNNCNANNNNITFNFGIFSNALTNNATSVSFLEKYFYCFWWGLQTLSSYGQNLNTSTYIGETTFVIGIVIIGLVLFAHLIGNMQNFLQSLTVRVEEWRLKRRDTEEWMRHRQLPNDLQSRVRRFVQYKWLATRGVDEESILHGLPAELRRDIQRHLCLDLIRQVPFFLQMDDQLQVAICERLVSSLCTQGTYVVREGDPVSEMLFIIRGRLQSSTTTGGRTGFFDSTILGPGDFCGEELLSWALLPKSTLPSSTRTVKTLDEVEAFALRAEDLKFVANQFRRLHSKKLQHTFRFYSHQWRTWAARFIQAAWRRHKKLMMDEKLRMMESCSYAQENPADETKRQEEEHLSISSRMKQNLGVRIMASLFAGNKTDEPALQKPDEPDFSAELNGGLFSPEQLLGSRRYQYRS